MPDHCQRSLTKGNAKENKWSRGERDEPCWKIFSLSVSASANTIRTTGVKEGAATTTNHRRSLSGRPGVVAANIEKFGVPGGKQTDQ